MILVYSSVVTALAALPSPTDLIDLPYLRTALLELGLLAIAGGLLGAWVVLRRLAFFAHAVGTATFPGLVVADATGVSATLAALAVALGFTGGVELIGRSRRDPGDVATALALVVALGLGVVLASDVFESGSAVDRLLFGTALGLGGEDLIAAGVATALAIAATAFLGRTLTATAFDRDASVALGLPVRAIDMALLAVVATAAVAALPAVGALLVSSLFVVPAATALLVTSSVRGLLAASVATALVQAVGGLYVSLWLDVPPGPAVAVVGATLYATVALARTARATPRPVGLEAA